MKSEYDFSEGQRGKFHNSNIVVNSISSDGIWINSYGQNYFLSYIDFPCFKGQAVKSVLNVKEESPKHFRWPDIDVDLSEEIICSPSKFPLKHR